MSINEKPPLDEAFLEHVGVKGMKWGARKNNTSGKDTTITITHQQKVTALTAVGAATTAALLYKTGTLKPLAAGGSKIALEGAKVSARILAEGGKFAVRSTFEVTKYAARSAYGVGAMAVKTAGALIGRSSVRSKTVSGPFRQRVNALIARQVRR